MLRYRGPSTRESRSPRRSGRPRAKKRGILEKAQENIENEVAKAKQELKEKVVELTLGTTEKLLKEKITGEKDEKLASDFLDELEKVK